MAFARGHQSFLQVSKDFDRLKGPHHYVSSCLYAQSVSLQMHMARQFGLSKMVVCRFQLLSTENRNV